MAITLADFNKIWASTSPLTPYSFSEANYKQGWNFIGSTPPARQMWDFIQKNNDEKMQYLANNYLPLSGGTLTGQLIVNKNNGSANAGGIKLVGGSQNFILSASNTDVTKGAAPSAIKYWGIDFYGIDTDNYNKRIGMIEASLSTDNVSSNSLVAYNCTTNTNTNTCKISVNVDGNGNAYTYAPTPANDDNSTKIATTAYVKSNIDSYLPLSGGTLTGPIRYNNTGGMIRQVSDDQRILICGGSDWYNGADLILYGKDNNAGRFELVAKNDTADVRLLGGTDGALKWDGKNVERVNASGTNYIRYESGLQICWGGLSVEGTAVTDGAVTFPQAFNNGSSYVVATSRSWAYQPEDYYIKSRSGTGFTWATSGTVSTNGHAYDYVAIGWWK